MSATQAKLKRERKRSREIFERAEKVLVGGVNSPVRAFRAVGGEPLIIERGNGANLYDADGNELLDYVCSWGAMILGHANPAISEAIAEQARRGTSFGVTTELELELAELIIKAIPFIEKIRFVSSGTEATMSAVRLARGVTKRDFILKFEGCYHGHADSFLSQAGSGLATLGIAECPGVPQVQAELTTLGKIIGGGLPVAAYGGSADLMNNVAPLGPVYQAGTLAGNPLAMSAGIAALKQLTAPGLYERINKNADRLVAGLRKAITETKVPAQVNASHSLGTIFFTDQPVSDYKGAKRSDTKRYARYFREMLNRGIFLAPSQFEAAFVSASHTSADIDRTIATTQEVLKFIAAQP